MPHRPAAADRSRDDRAVQRAARHGRGLGRAAAARSRRFRPTAFRTSSTGASTRASLAYTVAVVDADRHRLRRRAGIAGDGHAACRRACGRAAAAPPASAAHGCATRSSSREVALALILLIGVVAVRAQLPQSAGGAGRLRHGAADDDALLPAGRGVRAGRREGAPGGGHRAARRERCRACRPRSRRTSCRSAAAAAAATSSSKASPSRPARSRGSGSSSTTPHMRQTLGIALVRGRDFTDTEGDDEEPRRARQSDDGEAALGRRRSDRPAIPARRARDAGLVHGHRHRRGLPALSGRQRPTRSTRRRTCRIRSSRH